MKRWIPFAITCLGLVFLFGLLSGSNSEADHQQSRQALQARMNTTIAVVNADTGVLTDNGKLNYSAAIVDTLGNDYMLVSSVMAYTGYNNGTYGAVVTFPSDVSSKIISLNSKQPEKVQLEFQVNPNLSEKDYLETYTAILNLQLSINTTLAHTYVSSIYNQFHLAQNQVSGVFQNDLSDLDALGIVKLGDYTASLNLDEVPEIPLDPKKADTQPYMEQVTNFANEVSGWYLNSYDSASNQYIWMREGLIGLTDDLPVQEDDWLNELSDWSMISEEYGLSLEEYSADVRAHEDGLIAWFMENAAWNDNMTKYQTDVAEWHDNSKLWYGEAEDWYTEYQAYMDAAVEYTEEVTDYRADLTDSIVPVLEDMNDWKASLEEYMQVLYGMYEEVVSSGEEYNIHTEAVNYFLEELIEWHAGLDAYQDNLEAWKNKTLDRQYDLNDWQYELEYYQFELQTVIDELQSNIEALPPIPDVVTDSTIDPDDNTQLLANLEISGYEYNPAVYDTEIIFPDIPDYNSDPAIYATALTEWHNRLLNTYDEMAEWHVQLQDSSYELTEWQNRLLDTHNEMTIWHDQLQDFITALPVLTELPVLPDNSGLSYLIEPDQTELNEPDSVDLMDMLTLPLWDDTAYDVPNAYEGTEIPDEFAISIPESGIDIPERPSLDQPADYAGTDAPEMVAEVEPLTVDQPYSPLAGSPPRPEGFWSSLDQMHDQLSSFDIDEYLSDDVKQQVAYSLSSYEDYLDTVREDLARQFEDNIFKMYDVQSSYDDYLANLREDAIKAETTEQENLRGALDEYASIKERNSEDTHDRLYSFAGMMPESRSPAGLNRDLVGFTVRPFEFIPPALRSGTFINTSAIEPLAETYTGYLRIVVPIAGSVLLLTLLSYLFTYFRKKQRRDAEQTRRV